MFCNELPSTAEQLMASLSKATNRSMACSVFAEDVVSSMDNKEIKILKEWGIRFSKNDEPYDFDKATILDAISNPPAKKSGKERIDYARNHMPCIDYLSKGYMHKNNIFQGIRIAADLIIEPKTAVLILKLAELGANVAIACLASSADSHIIEALKHAGIKVYANTGNSVKEDLKDSIKILDDMKPNIIVDDGAGLSKLLFMERPEYANNLIGICEETTSGVWALKQMSNDGVLTVPAIAVNNSSIKTMFDNLHGTGETVILTIISLLTEAQNNAFNGNPIEPPPSIFSGKQVYLAGYGAVGSGIAKRISSLGAKVTITETSSVAALKALHDGYSVSKGLDAISNSDIIISATGVRHTLTKEIVENAKDGAIIAVAGGTYNEMALDNILGNDYLDIVDILKTENATWDIQDYNCCVLTLKSGKKLTVLTCGHGVNYTGGDGNPIEIMDLSFAGQFSAIAYLIENKGKLSPGVINLPEEIALDVAAVKLNSMNICTDSEKPPADWRITRYNSG